MAGLGVPVATIAEVRRKRRPPNPPPRPLSGPVLRVVDAKGRLLPPPRPSVHHQLSY